MGSWLPMETRVFLILSSEVKSLTWTSVPASIPSIFWSISKTPSALTSDIVVPAPLVRGVATYFPPIYPSLTLTNSRYLSEDMHLLVKVAATIFFASVSRPWQL